MNTWDGDGCVGRSPLAIEETYACKAEMCLFLLHCAAEGLSLSARRHQGPELHLCLRNHGSSPTSAVPRPPPGPPPPRLAQEFQTDLCHQGPVPALSPLSWLWVSLGNGTSSPAANKARVSETRPEKQTGLNSGSLAKTLTSTGWKQGRRHTSSPHRSHPHSASQLSWPSEEALKLGLCTLPGTFGLAGNVSFFFFLFFFF